MKKIKVNEKKYRADQVQLKRYKERFKSIKNDLKPINRKLKSI